MTRLWMPLAALILVAACQSTAPDRPLVTGADAPPWAPKDTCWGKTATPAVIETVTEQILVSPASYNPDGTLYRAAQYRTETRQNIVRERQENWFETPCPGIMTPQFIASLQRALQARSAYNGEISGVMDNPTREAVRRWQAARGLDSPILSLDTARDLGLAAIPRG